MEGNRARDGRRWNGASVGGLYGVGEHSRCRVFLPLRPTFAHSQGSWRPSDPVKEPLGVEKRLCCDAYYVHNMRSHKASKCCVLRRIAWWPFWVSKIATPILSTVFSFCASCAITCSSQRTPSYGFIAKPTGQAPAAAAPLPGRAARAAPSAAGQVQDRPAVGAFASSHRRIAHRSTGEQSMCACMN